MSRQRILLVDDEVGLTRMLAMYLREHGGHDVRVENAGSRALALARQFRPDIVFLDIVMPDADGAELAAQIKADPLLRSTRIVFLTALVSQQETRGGTTHIAGHPFLAKPVDPDLLLTYVDQCAD